MDLRLATYADFDDIKRMALDFHRASPYGHLVVDVEKLEKTLQGLLDSEDGLILLVSDEEGLPVGCLAGHLSEMIFSKSKVASEIIFWMDRPHQISFRLIDAFEYWARLRGCTHVHMSLLGDETGDRLGKIYNRKGYVNSERAYLKEL